VAAKKTAARVLRIVRYFGGDFGIRLQATPYWDEGGKTLRPHGVAMLNMDLFNILFFETSEDTHTIRQTKTDVEISRWRVRECRLRDMHC
jgi:hypothetical protein